MAVKVFIKRHVKEGKADEAYALLNKIRSKAMNQQGYISGETLVNHYDHRSITVISTWQSVDDWINWEESNQRAADEAQLESLLQEPAHFEVYDLGIPATPKK
ncbi:MAG: antibiotic biosynthesis monooxygenase [Desulfobacterales bacterium]|nr:MAG: antibiotic biosynthesis monooxygenase [Desulfobacterales bacterium]